MATTARPASALTALVQDLQQLLPVALSSSAGSEQGEIVVDKLRTVLLALLSHSSEQQGKRSEAAGILRMLTLVLERVPAVFNHELQCAAITRLLKLQCGPDHGMLKDQVLAAFCSISSLLASRSKELLHLIHAGVVELVLDLDHALFELSTAASTGAPDSRLPLQLPLFEGLQQALVQPQHAAHDNQQPQQQQDAQLLQLQIGDLHAWHLHARTAVCLLVHLLQELPLQLGPLTPPEIVPALGQLMSCTSAGLQAACMHAMSLVATLMPHEGAMCEAALQYTLWGLEAACDGLIPLEQQELVEWQAAAGACLQAAVAALLELQILPLHADRTVQVLGRLLANAAGVDKQALWLELLHTLVTQCPAHAPALAACLPTQPANTAAEAPLVGCWQLVGQWLSSAHMSGIIGQQVLLAEPSLRPPPALKRSVSGSGADGEGPVSPAKKRTRKLKQAHIAVNHNGRMMSQRPGGKPLSPTADNNTPAPPAPWDGALTPAMLAAASAAGLPHGMQAMAAAMQLLAAVQGLGPARAASSNAGGALGGAPGDADGPLEPGPAAVASLRGLRVLLQGLGLPDAPPELVQLLGLQVSRWLEQLLGNSEVLEHAGVLEELLHTLQAALLATADGVAAQPASLTGHKHLWRRAIADVQKLLALEACRVANATEDMQQDGPGIAVVHGTTTPLHQSLPVLALHVALAAVTTAKLLHLKGAVETAAAMDKLVAAAAQGPDAAQAAAAAACLPLLCALRRLDYDAAAQKFVGSQEAAALAGGAAMQVDGASCSEALLLADYLAGLRQLWGRQESEVQAALVRSAPTALRMAAMRHAGEAAALLREATGSAPGCGDAAWAAAASAVAAASAAALEDAAAAAPTAAATTSVQQAARDVLPRAAACARLADLEPLFKTLLETSAVSSAAVLADVQVAALDSLHVLLAAAPDAAMAGAKPLLRSALALLRSEHVGVRDAAVRLLPAFLRPAALLEAFGPANAVNGAAAALLQQQRQQGQQGQQGRGEELVAALTGARRDLLHELRQCLEACASPAAKVAVLRGAARLFEGLQGGDSRVMALVMLLDQLMAPNVQVSAAAVELLEAVAAAAGRTLEALLLRSPSTRVVLEYVGRHVADKPALLAELAGLLKQPEQELTKAVVPHVIGWMCRNQRREGLEVLARKMGMSVASLVINHAGRAIAEAFWFCYQDLGKFMSFVDDLIAPDDFLVVAKVCAHDIAQGIVWMAGAPEVWDGPSAHSIVHENAHMYLDVLANMAGMSGDSAVADLLQRQAVAVLLKSFGEQLGPHGGVVSGGGLGLGGGAAALMRVQEVDGERLQCIRALTVLIPLLGSYIGNHAPQIMAVLSEALHTHGSSPCQPLRLQALSGWCSFVRCLAAHAPQLLERVAAQASVVLLPVLEEGGEALQGAVNVLEEMVIKQRSHVRGALQRMPPLPSVPALERVNAALAQEQKLQSPHQQLRLLINSLTHEALSVRHAALGELHTFLLRHAALVSELIGDAEASGGASAAPAAGALPAAGVKIEGGGVKREGGSSGQAGKLLLEELLAALLACCDNAMRTGKGLQLKQRSAECLGLLGAVDPARVRPPLPRPDPICASQTDFLITLVTRHLVRMLETTSDIHQLEITNYAIQQLLQQYTAARLPDAPTLATQLMMDSASGGRNGGVGPPAGLYLLLPLDVKPIVTPFLTSKFTLEKAKRPAGEDGTSGTVFSSQPRSFRRWLECWLKRLISQCSGPLAPAFEATSGLLRWDLPLMSFLLPYVVINVVGHGGGVVQQGVYDEIAAVMQGAGSGTERVKEVELYIQCLFTLLDVLRLWVKDQQEALAAQKAASNSAPTLSRPSRDAAGVADGSEGSGSGNGLAGEVRAMADMLARIPDRMLASAASRCGAHARALQYYETHVRGVRGGGLNPAAYKTSVEYDGDDVSFLLEVYGQLEEPDGLAGLIHLRRGGLTSTDQILAAEKAGAWSEALALYEQALGHEGYDQTGNASGAGAAAAAAMAAAGGSGGGADGGGVAGGIVRGGLTQLQEGHLRCLLPMGHLQSLLRQVDGLLVREAGPSRCWLASVGVAAAWRLGAWGLLRSYLSILHEQGSLASMQPLGAADDWEVCIGSVLEACQRRDASEVAAGLGHMRTAIMGVLPAISAESYGRAYPQLLKLHMLTEMEDAFRVMTQEPALGPIERARQLRWPDRLRVTQPTLASREPLLALRRQLAALLDDKAEAGRCWLQHAKLCRATGHHEAAETAALEALAQGVPGAVLERAKLLWGGDKTHRAVTELGQAVRRFSDASAPAISAPAPGPGGPPAAEDSHGQARLVLQLAQWMSAVGQGSKEELTQLFEDAVRLDQTWERAHFAYAEYLDQLYQDAKQRQAQISSRSNKATIDRLGGRSRIPLGEDVSYLDYLPQVLQAYGDSIRTGHKHILQALPRLLTLYYDNGTEAVVARAKKPATNKERTKQAQITNIMKALAQTIPTFKWLLVLPQLTSRIVHPEASVQELTQALIGRLLDSFPQQGLWSLVAVCRATDRARKEAASGVLLAAKRRTDPSGAKLYDQHSKLCDQIYRLAMWQPPGGSKAPCPKTLSAKQHFGKLLDMLPLDVQVPVQDLFTVQLPPSSGGRSSGGGRRGGSSTGHHHYRPLVAQPTISSLKDTVDVMASLMRPKKITFVGSDGNEYSFLAKPKDDLRKDYRLMDLAGTLNHLLQASPPARRRCLALRTYAVLPITEDCGILQWVNNLIAFKAACEDVYTRNNPVLWHKRNTPHQIRKMYDAWTGSRRSDLLNKVLAILPPRMHRWFLARFPEPAAWLAARLAFTRTNAVWCMVGHMLGLGDRHGENILIDGVSGETMHVDFGCLFDRGLLLEVPEMVPFRLTQNVVDSFGVSGVEGSFRKCAEVALQVLRDNRPTLMTCAETFLHDPLVDWTSSSSSSSKSAGRSGADEGENPQAKDALVTLDGRLSGTLLGVSSIPCLQLSCEGQAARLIADAMDKEALARMYIWWMPWF